MAFGVNDAFPLAMFVHAQKPEDVEEHHLNGKSTVLLVDSVINEGKTTVNFVKHIWNLHPSIRIVVVAGVVQGESVSNDGHIFQSLKGLGKLSIVALRTSANKYTGSGGTDTGNRLFNTTYQTK